MNAAARIRILSAVTVAAAALAAIFAWRPEPEGTDIVVGLRSSLAGFAKVYYAEGEEPFRELNSVACPVPAESPSACRFALPFEPGVGTRIRFDPIDQPGAEVEISGLVLERRSGLRVSALRLPPAGLTATAHAAVLPGADGLTVRAESNDPQMAVDWAAARPDAHLDPAAWMILILLAGFLFLIFHPLDVSGEAGAVTVLVYAAALLWIALQGQFYISRIPYGIPPDETAHISYLAHLEDTGRCLPDRPHSFIFNRSGTPQAVLNHLAHPALFYDLFKPFVPSEPFQITGSYLQLRRMNLALALAGLAFFFWIAARQNVPLAFHVYFAAALSSVPILPYLAGAMNNDNASYLAGAAALYGALLFLEKGPRSTGTVWLGAGLCIALLTKATAGLHTALFAALVVGARAWKDRSFRSLLCPQAALAAALLSIPLAYYAALRVRYGTFTPSRIGPAFASLTYGPVLRPWDHFQHFMLSLGVAWTGILSHADLFKQSAAERLPMLAPILLALAGLGWPVRGPSSGEDSRRFWLALRFAGGATFIFLFLHWGSLYLNHTKAGYIGGMQARYYFSLMPAVLMLSYRPFLPVARRPWALALQAVLIAGFLWSGFYYFALRHIPPAP